MFGWYLFFFLVKSMRNFLFYQKDRWVFSIVIDKNTSFFYIQITYTNSLNLPIIFLIFSFCSHGNMVTFKKISKYFYYYSETTVSQTILIIKIIFCYAFTQLRQVLHTVLCSRLIMADSYNWNRHIFYSKNRKTN